MSLATNLGNAFQAVGNDIKSLWTKIGSATLTTTATTLAGAINEVKASIPVLTSLISDGTTSTSTVWSSTKVNTQINAVIDSAPGALNTLNELAAALGNDANYAATITTALGAKAVAADVGDTTTDFVGIYNTAKA